MGAIVRTRAGNQERARGNKSVPVESPMPPQHEVFADPGSGGPPPANPAGIGCSASRRGRRRSQEFRTPEMSTENKIPRNIRSWRLALPLENSQNASLPDTT